MGHGVFPRIAAALWALTLPWASAEVVLSASYGAYASGGINNSGAQPPGTPGVASGGGAFYFGTDNQNGVGSAESAAGSIGAASWGLSSASADLASGALMVSATSEGAPPYNSSPPPYGSPASAQAGYFVQLVFSGGEGQTASVSMGGLASYVGDVSFSAGLDISEGTFSGMAAGSSVISGSDLAQQTGVAWSLPAVSFTIEDDVVYTLTVDMNLLTSGSFLPGSASFTDPLLLTLPEGATYTASDPNFLSAADAGTSVPEPPPWALIPLALGVGLGARRWPPRPRRHPQG